MSNFLYVLKKFAQKTGIPCVDYNGTVADEEQRIYAAGFINEGAEELYNAADHIGSLEEITLSLNPLNQLALPSFVGKIRALREFSSYVPWKISTVRPRYHTNSWPEESYRNYRDKGIVPICNGITNVAPPKAVITTIESEPIEVTIVGSTNFANRISETVVCTALTNNFTQSFTSYESISKNRINTVDVLITDADDNELAMVYNNEYNSNYRLVDLAQYIFTDSNTPNMTFEILYKKKFKEFYNDSDTFIVPYFYDAIVNKAVQLFSEDKGDVNKAALYDAKAQRTTERIALDELKGKDLRIEFQEHPHNSLGGRNRRFYFRR